MHQLIVLSCILETLVAFLLSGLFLMKVRPEGFRSFLVFIAVRAGMAISLASQMPTSELELNYLLRLNHVSYFPFASHVFCVHIFVYQFFFIELQ